MSIRAFDSELSLQAYYLSHICPVRQVRQVRPVRDGGEIASRENVKKIH
jgi:hypothetical protein